MGDNLPKFLRRWVSRLRGIKAKKRNILIFTTFLVLGTGLFFYTFFVAIANAKNSSPTQLEDGSFKKVIQIGDKTIKTSEKTPVKSGSKVCQSQKPKTKIPNDKLGEKDIQNMVAGHPIEEMVPHIAKRDKKVASYLVAIAKKESDWGLHTPKKQGRECYNFWGYRSGYNATESGYTCFDNPEQAVKVVGDRIEALIAQQINTPERMVVWKCGRDCEAAGGQAAANKWISDVRSYYTKLNS